MDTEEALSLHRHWETCDLLTAYEILRGEIERLRAENEALREALKKIIALGAAMPDEAEEVLIAKAALAAGRER